MLPQELSSLQTGGIVSEAYTASKAIVNNMVINIDFFIIVANNFKNLLNEVIVNKGGYMFNVDCASSCFS